MNNVLVISDLKAPIREKWVLECNNFEVYEASSSNLKLNGPVSFVLLLNPLPTNFRFIIAGLRSMLLLKDSPILVITDVASKLSHGETNIYYLSWPYQDSELKELSIELAALSKIIK